MHDDTVPDEVQPRKRRKGIYVLPNLFTLAALFGGFYSVAVSYTHLTLPTNREV